MKKSGLLSLLCFLLTSALSFFVITSCKTNENNYRKAYERATAQNDRNVTDFESTIYNRYRGNVKDVTLDVDGTPVNARIATVRLTDDGGGIREWLKKYNVVVGEFKQKFNANSLRSRFVDAGYPRTFLVENGEPYYYIVVASSDNVSEIAAFADSMKVKSPVPLKDGFPYILQVAGR